METSRPNGSSVRESTRDGRTSYREHKSWFSMTKGDGEESYSKNSTAQKYWVEQGFLPGLYEALEHVALPSHGPIRLADLGCSSGPNSIRNVDSVVEKLREKSADPAREFQGFFNDLAANDFNNLFQLFNDEVKGNFFAAGVPGSFHGRLFPRSTVHVFLSTNALHYLSKIPDAVVAKDSPSSNKQQWRLAPESSMATAIAYQEQASSDLKNFLDARAAELAPGGLLCFAAGHRTSQEPNKQSVPPAPVLILELIDIVWHELLCEGIITEEQSNVVNFPLYSRSIEEVLKDVKSCSSEYEVLTVKAVAVKTFGERIDPVMAVVGFSKGIAYGFFENHLGKATNEIFWQRVEETAKKMRNAALKIFTEAINTIFFVALIKRGE